MYLNHADNILIKPLQGSTEFEMRISEKIGNGLGWYFDPLNKLCCGFIFQRSLCFLEAAKGIEINLSKALVKDVY